MGLSLPHGGHLTHGMKINVSGRLYEIVPYEVSPEDHRIDMDEVERLAHEHRPKMILAGWSAYSRVLDFPRFKEIADEVGAYLMVDMAHFAGLVAAGEHPNPVPYADVDDHHGPQDTRRPALRAHPLQGGVREEDQLRGLPRPAGRPARARDRGQGRRVQDRGVATSSRSARSARSRARRRSPRSCSTAGSGVNVLTGGTDVHLVLVDLRDSELDGQQAEDRLDSIGITVNRNAVPFDPRPPMVTSGLRIGTPALATRGLQVDDFHEVGAHHRPRAAARLRGCARRADRARDARSSDRYPLYAHLRAPATV